VGPGASPALAVADVGASIAAAARRQAAAEPMRSTRPSAMSITNSRP
jgi:hypothetical protein